MEAGGEEQHEDAEENPTEGSQVFSEEVCGDPPHSSL